MTGDLEAILETGSAAAVEIAASALAEKGQATGVCANCGKPLIGAYCAVCGQPTHTHRRSVRGLLHDIVSDLVNFDSRILRTGRALLFQPGELPLAFRKGRTQPFVPAIRLYLFVSLIFFVLLSVTRIALMQLEVTATPTKVVWVKGEPFIANPAYDKNDIDPDTKDIIKPLMPITKDRASQPGGVYQYGTNVHFFSRIGAYHSTLSKGAREQLQRGPGIKIETKDRAKAEWVERKIYDAVNRIAADPAALNEPLTTWMPRALFLLLPLYALLLALFHLRRRKEFYLVDHLVFSLSIHTFAFVALIVGVGLAQLIAGGSVAWILFIALSLYIFLAMKRFYVQSWVTTAVKFLFISGIYTMFFLLPALAGVLTLSIFGGFFG